jgi:hydroxylaminobenzene mutase
MRARAFRGGCSEVFMDANRLSRQGHRMLQLGVALIAFVSLEGLAIAALPVPRLGLSVHTLATFQALLFIGLGLLWPRLTLGRTSARVAWWTYVYSSFATLAAYLMAAMWGAGGDTIPLATGGAHGTALQETLIRSVLVSSGPPVFAALGLIIHGLRVPAETAVAHRAPIAGAAR